MSDADLAKTRIEAVRSMYLGASMQDLVLKDPGAYADMWPMIAVSSVCVTSSYIVSHHHT